MAQWNLTQLRRNQTKVRTAWREETASGEFCGPRGKTEKEQARARATVGLFTKPGTYLERQQALNPRVEAGRPVRADSTGEQ